MKFGNAAPATGQKKNMVFSIMALGLDPPPVPRKQENEKNARTAHREGVLRKQQTNTQATKHTMPQHRDQQTIKHMTNQPFNQT